MVEAEFSLQKWCHRFNSLVMESGFVDTSDLAPNLSFAPRKPVPPDVESARIAATRRRGLKRFFQRNR